MKFRALIPRHLNPSCASHSLPTHTHIPTPADPPRTDSVLTPPQPPQDPEALDTCAPLPRPRIWPHLLATHLVIATSFGLIQATSTLTPSYPARLHASSTAVSWIASTPVFLAYALAPATPYILHYICLNHLLLVGAACQVVGLVVAGCTHSYGVTLVFQGVLVGVGHGVTFAPAVARLAMLVGGVKWKTTVLSLAGCGAGTGGMVFASLARGAMERLGVARVLWVAGGVVGVNAVVVQVLLRWAGVDEEKLGEDVAHEDEVLTRSWAVWQLLKNRTLVLYTIAIFFTFVGLWIPYFDVRTFAVDALDMDSFDCFAVLMILNTSGIPGRIVPALLADSVLGTINTYILVLLSTSTVLLCWPLVKSGAGMFVWAGSYGFFSGGTATLVQAGVLSLCDDKRRIGLHIGIVFGAAGAASLVITPVGGELIKSGAQLLESGMEPFLLLQLCTGGAMLLGCAALIAARAARIGWAAAVRI
ncbi:major facilitator superfamily domain-containing protein [Boeremia exigua]|uniref:major facilitator superfamily domain-containing protein n=1 Tax=Boeremia exigua TaxID=749465 RepID=UPI001E8E71B6|nr:major facilitator superfamily domain-containing protein [Boeremia exigua]KAH6642935.1 major facilitator superfamily domain-containing protein [Boeremia exigua]